MKNQILDISFEEYIADPCEEAPSLSRSTICDLINGKTPAHVYHGSKRLNPHCEEEVAEAKFDFGTASHALLLEGEDVMEVIEADSWRTKDAKEARDAAREAGKIPMLPPQAEVVTQMVYKASIAIIGCKELGITSLLSQGKSEQTYLWKSGETWMRARPDWVRNDNKLILDYKTTGKLAHPDEFIRNAISLGYDIQDYLHTDGVHRLHGTDPDFVFVVQETTPPYLVSFIGLDGMAIDMAIDKIKYGKKIWNECLKTGIWPGYPNKVAYVDTPPYALTNWEFKKEML
ncbi:MAG: PD-(D/E)XK nuclease-like domain-containing protein [Deltaproteobacteria bacterium]|nr:PD-(D/E)XK nuclease-like domain-containing protein [Deltaproteobacteria bacterium]